MWWSRLTRGPLNHFRASTTHQISTPSIGPPYTTAVQFMFAGLDVAYTVSTALPRNGGDINLRQLRARIRRKTQDRQHQDHKRHAQHPDDGAVPAQAPRAGPELLLDDEHADGNGDRKGDERGDGADGEQGAHGQLAGEDQQRRQNADGAVDPHCVHGRRRALVDLLPDVRIREAAVARVRVRDSRRGDHAAVAHREAADDGQRENGHGEFPGHHLEEERRPGLRQVRLHHLPDVLDRVCYRHLQKPARNAAKRRREHDGSGRRNVGVGAFFCEMEGGIVSGHGPNHADERHEDGYPVWIGGPLVHFLPDVCRRVEPWGICGPSRDSYKDSDEGEKVES
ncbi:hypothetical protein LOZ36_006280 [Ophidiomyces ophidiicola]|nr:hypothetical protein LOZ36_006280 [Ophidiomyces ophidiicola]